MQYLGIRGMHETVGEAYWLTQFFFFASEKNALCAGSNTGAADVVAESRSIVNIAGVLSQNPVPSRHS